MHVKELFGKRPLLLLPQPLCKGTIRTSCVLIFGMSATCGNENRFEICFEPSGPIAFKAKHNELSLRVSQLWSFFIYLLQGDYVFGKDRLFFLDSSKVCSWMKKIPEDLREINI